MTCPFTGIVVPSHSVNETRGKVFKLDLKTRRYKILLLIALQLLKKKSADLLNLTLFYKKDARLQAGAYTLYMSYKHYYPMSL